MPWAGNNALLSRWIGHLTLSAIAQICLEPPASVRRNTGLCHQIEGIEHMQRGFSSITSHTQSSASRLFVCCWLALLLGWPTEPLTAQTKPTTEPADTRPGDVVLITIDTLRADALGFAGHAKAATPNLDRLARQGRVFTNAHAHNVVTLPSHANILTGLYPYQHGVRDNEGFRLADDIPTLGTVLASQGYSTGAFVSAYPLDSIFGLARGFDVYDDRYGEGGQGHAFAMAERRGDETVAAAMAWWKATPGPRFLWLHLYDPHAPYDAPEPFASRFEATPYLAEVAAVDHFLAPLLAPFLAPDKAAPLIIMTSDHGESLGEHGELTHGLFAYEATLAVPLVVWGPGIEPGIDPRPARHIDIFPTVLGRVGLAPPPTLAGPADGQPYGHSLLAPAPPTARTYFEALSASLNRGWAPLYGLIDDNHKLIVLPLPELYALAQDPREANNLVRQARQRAADLRDALPTRSQVWPSSDPRTVDGASSEALQSLGYLGGAAEIRQTYGIEDDPKNLITLDRKLHQAIDLYSRRQLDDALSLSREIITERPSMGLGQSLHAQILLQAGRREEALQAMLAAQKLGGAQRPLLRQMGLTLSELGRHADALAVLRPLAEEDPRRLDVASHQALALALSEAGQQEAAQSILDNLLADDGDDPQTLEHLSLVALRRGRWQDASRWAQLALARHRSLPRAHNNLGVALAELGDLEGAVDAWQRAVDLDPELFDALYNLATQALALEHFEQAQRALRRFVDQAPEAIYSDDLRRARVLLRRLERRRDPS